MVHRWLDFGNLGKLGQGQIGLEKFQLAITLQLFVRDTGLWSTTMKDEGRPSKFAIDNISVTIRDTD